MLSEGSADLKYGSPKASKAKTKNVAPNTICGVWRHILSRDLPRRGTLRGTAWRFPGYIYIYILESSGALRAPLILLYSEALAELKSGLLSHFSRKSPRGDSSLPPLAQRTGTPFIYIYIYIYPGKQNCAANELRARSARIHFHVFHFPRFYLFTDVSYMFTDLLYVL